MGVTTYTGYLNGIDGIVGFSIVNGQTILNYGTFVGSYGVVITGSGGSFSNDGLIGGSLVGILDFGYVQGFSPITNAGTILGAVVLDEEEKTNSSVLVLSNTGLIDGGLVAGEELNFYYPDRSNTIISIGTIEVKTGDTAIQLVGPGYNVTLGGAISGQTAVLMNGYVDQLTVLSGITLNGNIVDYSPGSALNLGRIAGSLPGVATINTTAAHTIGAGPFLDGSVSIAPDAAWVLDVPDVSKIPIISGFSEGDTLELTGFTASGVAAFPGLGLYLTGSVGGVFLPLAGSGTNTFILRTGSFGTAVEVGSSTLPVTVANGNSAITGGFYSIGSTVMGNAPLTVTDAGVTITPGGSVNGSAGAAGQNFYEKLHYEVDRGYNFQYVPAGNGAPGMAAIYLRNSVLLNSGAISGGAGGLGGLGIQSYVRYERTGKGGIGVVINDGILFNDGTISGGYGNSDQTFITSSSGFTHYDSVSFSGSGTLVVDSGAVFNGTVVANSTDVLVLVNPTAVEIDEVGTLFRGFGVVDIVGTTVPCFCAGTRIRTPDGEVPVESLSIGDLVETAFAGPKPIKWIGLREYQWRFVANNYLVLPVCIKANAIAANVPSRDLWVSPGHAICIDGALVQAGRLVNGVSITQPARDEDVIYLHIEIENHEVIFAENCPAETFLGEEFREQFHNAAEFRGQRAPALPCLPRVEQGFWLEAAMYRLAKRAGLAPECGSGRLMGYVDLAGPTRWTGWARQDSGTVCLDMIAEGRRIARVLANGPRQDLRRAGIGRGEHAFEIRTEPFPPVCVEIRRAVDGAALNLTDTAAA